MCSVWGMAADADDWLQRLEAAYEKVQEEEALELEEQGGGERGRAG